jgi:hypothetical protein
MLLCGVRTFLPDKNRDDKAVCGAKVRILEFRLQILDFVIVIEIAIVIEIDFW